MPIKPPSEAERDQTAARCFYALQALHTVEGLLVEQDKATSAAESKVKTEATQAYREILRHEEPKTQKAAAQHFHDAKAGLAKMDEVAEANRQAKSSRKEKIAAVKAAIAETHAVQADKGNGQGDLFGGGKVDGLDWASDGTRKTIFTSLSLLDERDGLNEGQKPLFEDMARAGMETVDLGLGAADAIEVEDQPEDLGDNPEELAPDDVPF